MCVALLAACVVTALVATTASAAAGPRRPFPQHLAYVAGSIKPNHKPQSELDTKVKQFYAAWKAKFLRQGCGAGNYYVYLGPQSDIGEGTPISVSEAQSYGMLIVVHMAGRDAGAKRLFDGLYRFFKAHPSQHDPYLMAWRQLDDCRDSSDPNSATDGDLSIAHALLLAHVQWGSDNGINYRAEALKIINAVRAHDIDPVSDLPQLGDWVHPTYPTEYNAVRTSDVMPEHFREFWQASGKAVWKATLDESYALLDTLQRLHAPLTGLVPDFAVDTHSSPRPAPNGFKGEPRPGAYDYNACRAPCAWRSTICSMATCAQSGSSSGWRTGSSARPVATSTGSMPATSSTASRRSATTISATPGRSAWAPWSTPSTRSS